MVALVSRKGGPSGDAGAGATTLAQRLGPQSIASQGSFRRLAAMWWPYAYAPISESDTVRHRPEHQNLSRRAVTAGCVWPADLVDLGEGCLVDRDPRQLRSVVQPREEVRPAQPNRFVRVEAVGDVDGHRLAGARDDRAAPPGTSRDAAGLVGCSVSLARRDGTNGPGDAAGRVPETGAGSSATLGDAARACTAPPTARKRPTPRTTAIRPIPFDRPLMRASSSPDGADTCHDRGSIPGNDEKSARARSRPEPRRPR